MEHDDAVREDGLSGVLCGRVLCGKDGLSGVLCGRVLRVRMV